MRGGHEIMSETAHRDITPFVSRRAWIDPRVRAWWLLGAVLLVIAGSLAAQQFAAWSKLHSAIASGVTVQGTVVRAEIFGQRRFSSNTPMILSFTHEGKAYEVHGTLEGMDRFVSEHEVVPLHIDPADPYNWTARTEVPSLAVAMIGSILVLPVALFMLLASLIARLAVIRTYRNGKHVSAIVSANKQTPLAPRSRAVHCSLTPGGRTFEVFVPHGLAKISVGENIDVLMPPRGGRPLSIAWFEE